MNVTLIKLGSGNLLVKSGLAVGIKALYHLRL